MSRIGSQPIAYGWGDSRLGRGVRQRAVSQAAVASASIARLTVEIDRADRVEDPKARLSALV